MREQFDFNMAVRNLYAGRIGKIVFSQFGDQKLCYYERVQG